MLIRKIYYSLNSKQRLFLRKLVFFPLSIFDYFQDKDQVYPPKHLIYTGRGNFKKMGNYYLQLLIEHTNLKPNHSVLDIGCGIGRLAIPLTKYLNTDGYYFGFDVVELGIKWCKKNIESKYPNFNFLYVPLKNDLYNQFSDLEAENFKIPADKKFDLIVAISVFTHLQPDVVKNYLQQTAYLLKDEGYAFFTFFLLNDEAIKMDSSRKKPFFKYYFDAYALHNVKVKDANVGYKTDFLQKLFADAGLEIFKQFDGWWCGRNKEKCLDFQDIFILRKKQCEKTI